MASDINLLAIFIDLGVDPFAGTSANLLLTMSIYLSAFVAALRRILPSVKGVAATDVTGVAGSFIKIEFVVGDFPFKGVEIPKLDLLFS